MMILYVLSDHIRKNEATKDIKSQMMVDLVVRLSMSMTNLANNTASKDAKSDTAISMAKITLVLRYLLKYFFSFCIIHIISMVTGLNLF